MQVVKEPLGHEGRAHHVATSRCPGRYLVFMPTVEHVGVSRKITDDDERRRLKTSSRSSAQQRGGGGLIARTAGAGRDREDFERDMQYLSRTWDEVARSRARQRAPALLLPRASLVQRLLRDLLSDDIAPSASTTRRSSSARWSWSTRSSRSWAARPAVQRPQAILEEYGVARELERALRVEGLAPVRRLHRHQPDRGAGRDRRQHRALTSARRPRGHDRQDEPGGGARRSCARSACATSAGSSSSTSSTWRSGRAARR